MGGLDIDEMSEYLGTKSGKKKFKKVVDLTQDLSPTGRNQFLYKAIKNAKTANQLEMTQNTLRRLGYKESDIISKTEMVKRHNAGFWH